MSLDIVLTLKGRNQFGRVAASAKKQIDELSRSAARARIEFGKMPVAMPALSAGADRARRATDQLSRSTRAVADRWKGIPLFVQTTEGFTDRINRKLGTQRKTLQAITLEEARRTEQIRHQDRMIRQQARRELGIGGKPGGDPDAPAINATIAGRSLSRFGAAGRQGIRAVTGDARELEKAITDVVNLGGAMDANEVNRATAAAAKRFGTDQTQQVLAYYAAVSAGATDAAKAEQVLVEANRLGIVGRADQETATLAITKAMANFGVTAEEAANSLFGAIQAGQVDADDMSSALPRVAQKAASLGLTLQETNATLALMSRKMASGDQAATAFGAALAAVDKGARKGTMAAEEAKRLGINFSRAGIQAAGGWEQFIQKIVSNPKFNSKTLGKLFESDEARNAIKAMTGEGALFDQILRQTATDANALADGMARVGETKSFKLSQQTAALDEFKNKIGAIEVGALSRAAEMAGPAIEAASRFVDNHPDLAAALAMGATVAVGTASVAGPALQAAGGVAGLAGYLKQMRTGSMQVAAGVVNVNGAGAGSGLGGAAGGGAKGKIGRAAGFLGKASLVVGAGVATYGATSWLDEALGATDSTSRGGISGAAARALGGGSGADRASEALNAAGASEGDRVSMARKRVLALEKLAEEEGLNDTAGGGVTMARRFFSDTDEQLAMAQDDLRKATESSGVVGPEMQGFKQALDALTKAFEGGLALKLETDSGTKIAKVGGKGTPKRGSALGVTP